MIRGAPEDCSTAEKGLTTRNSCTRQYLPVSTADKRYRSGFKVRGLQLSLVALFAALSLTCEDQGMDYPLRGALLPLYPGNFWKYEMYSWYSQTATDTVTLRVEREVVIERDGQSFSGYAVRWYRHGNVPDDYALIYRNKYDGLYLVAATTQTDTLVLDAPYRKWPVRPGDRWEVPNVLFDRITGTSLVKGTIPMDCGRIDAPFATPAGEFPCLEFHYSQRVAEDVVEPWHYSNYWAPGLGQVGGFVRNSSGPDDIVVYRFVLCGYEVH